MGFSRSFPRILVHTPLTYNGLGKPHKFTLQELGHLQSIINHTRRQTSKGLLYRAALENLIVEVRIRPDILSSPFHLSNPLMMNCLIKNTWNFLSTQDIILQHDIVLPQFRALPLCKYGSDLGSLLIS
jgi:hypothetical protein